MGNADMTEAEIQHRLMRPRYQRNMTIPNFTPRGWFECDLFEMTDTGRFREYEIKLTRSDFLADCGKMRERFDWNTQQVVSTVKHELLKKRNPKGPTQFWYVVPAGLIAVEMVPEWAGLIVINPESRSELEMKAAPKLHREKLDPATADHARGICYWRMMKLLMRKSYE